MRGMSFTFAKLLIFFVIVRGGTSIARASEVMELDQAASDINPESEDKSLESFPLMELPEFTSQPPRSEAPNFHNEEKWHSLKSKILTDFGSRIARPFHVQEGLKQRTEFWFDIYAKYGEAHHLVHHVLFPWIVYRVIDTGETLHNGKGPLWLRRDRAQKMAARQLQEIRAALTRLSKRKEYNYLTQLERELYDKLIPIKGPRRKVFQIAAANVRSQLGQRDFFQQGLVNSSRYLPYMEAEFNRLGLPIELTRMPFVESSFNENARSKVGASGIWQIMPRTGKSYMIVNDHIDERNSPLKATTTAGRLLLFYNRVLGSWPLTITSYNHGIGNIQKAVRHTGTQDLVRIIATYQRGDFRFASSNFYTCFLAALFAEKYHELIFNEVPREPLQEREVLKLTGKTTIKYLRKITGLPLQDLLRYNLDIKYALRANAILPRGFLLHLPVGYRDRVGKLISSIDSTNHSNN
jgi:membrane-bound lytic murein transglycosylase D